MEYINAALYSIKTFSLLDALDILIVAYFFYRVIKLIHGTSVEMVIKGILIFVLMWPVSELLGLNVVSFILKNTLQLGLIALVIMFQPELRRMLEQMGRTSLPQFFDREATEGDTEAMIRETVDACSSMSWSRTGALIVFERANKMEKIVAAGTSVDAKPTSELIKNIFYNKAPLHDGAMIMANGRIMAAGCVLPLSENESLSKELGTRHRAGIGITEVTDAVVVIVSEETGSISVAIKGEIRRNLAPEALENTLRAELMNPEEETELRKRVFSLWKGRSK